MDNPQAKGHDSLARPRPLMAEIWLPCFAMLAAAGLCCLVSCSSMLVSGKSCAVAWCLARVHPLLCGWWTDGMSSQFAILPM